MITTLNAVHKVNKNILALSYPSVPNSLLLIFQNMHHITHRFHSLVWINSNSLCYPDQQNEQVEV